MNYDKWVALANDPWERERIERLWRDTSGLSGTPIVIYREVFAEALNHPKLTPEGRAWFVGLLMNGWP